jgi:hypothetical protein
MLPEETEAGCQPDKARANKVDFLAKPDHNDSADLAMKQMDSAPAQRLLNQPSASSIIGQC